MSNQSPLKIRLYSDIHEEISRVYNKKKYIPWCPIELPDDKNTVLVLAGDIDKAKFIPLFLNRLSDRFKAIIHIPGNHEYYSYNILSGNKKMKENLNSNVYSLHDESIVIDNVKFICGTMWSPLNHPLAQYDVQRAMNDYRMIRHGPVNRPWSHKLRTEDTMGFHYQWRKFAYDELNNYKGKTVVVTHNSPWTPRDNNPLSEGWNSSQEDFILDMKPNLWLFGHDHSASDKILFNTRIISNCVGYPTEPKIYKDNIINI